MIIARAKPMIDRVALTRTLGCRLRMLLREHMVSSFDSLLMDAFAIRSRLKRPLTEIDRDLL
ncbi:MAG: hypothetical protein ACM33U_05385, partial [Solirubrobacterales bacterium]